MLKNNNHIVACCHWNTSFDNKDKGTELQNAISYWSEHHMPREISSVFDVVCPEEQTLKIKSLELNLGIINYENLEESLYLKLKAQLLLKLNDILMYPSKYSQSIEVVTEENTHLTTLKYFLLKGVMPWNYQKIKGSVNEIFEHQLQHNKQEMMLMIEEVGVKEYVRKRIAWQLKEEHIKEIIKNIERSNDNYIIEFSEEFVKIQEQESIVKTNLQDFKKNLLFWILNYLFAERGTMFNKIEFVQSNIQQMARHFNMEYYELFALIEDAVDNVHEQSYVKNNFILILSILSQKQQNNFYKYASTERQIEKQWQLLEYFLQSPNNCSTVYQKKRLEELIHYLSTINSFRFKETISFLDNHSFNTLALSENISEESLSILCKALSPTNGVKLISQITFLGKLELEKHFKLSKKWLFGKGVLYLKEKKGSFSCKEFSNYIINEVNKTQKTPKIKIFERILNTPLLTTHKNTENLDVFKGLKQLYTLELSKEIPTFSKKQLVKILNELEKTSTKGKQSRFTEQYYAILHEWLREKSKAVWKVFTVYKNQKFIKELLFELLSDTRVVIPVLKNVFPKQYRILKRLELSIDEVVSSNQALLKSLKSIKKELLIKASRVLISNQKLNTTSFIKLVLELLIFQEQQSNSKLYEEGVMCVVESFFKKNEEFSETQKKELKVFVNTIVKVSVLERVKKYIEEYNNKQKEVAVMLTVLVREKKVSSKDFKQYEKKISQYLLKDGYTLQENFIKEYQKQKDQFSRFYSAVEIKKVITEIYWQSIADYQVYKGDKIKFTTFFKASILEFLGGVKNEIDKGGKSKKLYREERIRNSIKFKGQTFLVKEILYHIKKAIKNGVLKIEIKGKSLGFKEVFFFLLEEYPTQIHDLLRDKTITEKQIKGLQSVIPFQQFIILIAKGRLRAVYKDISTLFSLVQEFVDSSTKIEKEFWRETIQLIRNHKKTRELKGFIKIVLEELSVKEIRALDIVRVIKDKDIKLPSTLKQLLVKRSSTFELLEELDKENNTPKIITPNYKRKTLERLIESLCIEDKIPSWFLHLTPVTIKGLINEVLRDTPLIVVSVLRKNIVSDTQLSKLADKIKVETLIKSLKELYPNQQIQLNTIEKLYKAIGHISTKSINAEEVQQVLLIKVLKSWITSNWKLIGATSIWKELLWEVCTKKNIEERQFLEALDDVKTQLPTQLQLSYNELEKLKRIENTTQNKIRKQESMNEQNNDKLAVGITVPNAGIVLLNSYFLILFERLNLVKDNNFISEEKRLDAIHYLQYIVTGMTKTEESLLALNKVFCNVPLSQPIHDEIQMSNKDKKLIEGLLEAAIDYWNAIGATSIQGFRGNWLVRNGILREEEDRWSLTVEKRPYDVLMLKSPFSFSIIKLPWMPKPLHVTWPF